jgi:hypothetical protein
MARRLLVPRAMRPTWLFMLVLAACPRHHHDARPLREALVGSWNIVCSIQDEHTSRCPGDDGRSTYYTFHAGGVVELGGGATSAPLDRGTWTLDGDALDVRFAAGGGTELDQYRARIDDDQLVLWDAPRGFGTILVRKGAQPETEPLAVTVGGATSGKIKDVRYTIDLPTGYALTHDGDYQRWSPPGNGLYVEIQVTPTTDCRDGGVSGARKVVDGVEREYAAGIDLCIARDRYLSCSVEHTRGYLEPGEHDDALALCRTLEAE